MSRLAPIAFAVLCACASARPSPTVETPPGLLHGDHPLAGRIWDVRAGAMIDDAALEAAVRGARFVLLGETHDNPLHHLRQARLLTAAAQGRTPAAVFEMIDSSKQPAVDAAASTGAPEAIASAVAWEKSGWPAFAMYRPIFAAALGAKLPIVAGTLPREQSRALAKGGISALPEPLAALLTREGPQAPEVVAAVSEEMKADHCGQLPEAMVGPMVLVQRAWDAALASRMAESDHGAGAVLIAGSGHVRADRAVPAHLSFVAPGQRALSVAMLEVKPGLDAPAAYAAELRTSTLPFDYVVFTPAAPREDPCAGLGEKLRKAR